MVSEVSIPCDDTASISRSAIRFFSGTALSRVSGMLRDMAMAFAFGTSSAVALFMMAYRFAHLLRRLLGEGAMQSAFIPLFEDVRSKSDVDALQFFRDLTATLVVTLVAFTAVTSGLLWLLALYGSGDTAHILRLTAVMFPGLLFLSLFGINMAFLQCEGRYFAGSVAPVAFNGIWIAATLWLSKGGAAQSTATMVTLSAAVVVACMGQWAVTLPQTVRALRRDGTRGIFGGGRCFSKEVRRIGRPLSLGMLGIAAAQINSALDTIFARMADPQGPAMLWYAIRLQQLPLALFGIALSGALLPPLSRAAKEGNGGNFARFLGYALDRSSRLMVPCTAALIVVGTPLVGLLFGRGTFDMRSILGTTPCLWGYAAGLLPMTLVLVLAPAYYARGDYTTPMRASVLSVCVNIGLNTLFVVGCGFGPASVAVATSISAVVNVTVLFMLLPGEYFQVKGFVWSLTRLLLQLGLATGISLLLSRMYGGNFSLLAIVWGATPSLGSVSIVQQVGHVIIPALPFVVVALLQRKEA